MHAHQLLRVVRNSATTISVGLFVLLLQGCRERTTTVSGAITLDGRNLNIAKDARGTVIFQPDGGRGTTAVGLLDSSGHFNLATGSSTEVAPGKYYVSVSVSELLPKEQDVEQGAKLVT